MPEATRTLDEQAGSTGRAVNGDLEGIRYACLQAQVAHRLVKRVYDNTFEEDALMAEALLRDIDARLRHEIGDDEG